ncbi:MAG TPA: AAA family ATPase [Acidimicrobiales bacterium]
MAFVGRTSELGQLLDWFDEAAAGEPRVVLLEGEAGMGKSRLVAELVTRATPRATILSSRCQEDLNVPYLPLAAALRDLAPALSGGRVRSDPERSTADDRLELFLSTTRAVLDHAESRPTALIVDDLHWADRASIDLLGHLVATAAIDADTGGARLMVVLPYRPTAADPAILRALARFVRDPITRTMRLAGLPALSVNELVASVTGSRPSRALVRELIASSAGNPLLVLSLVDRLETFGALSIHDGELVSKVGGEVLGLPLGLDAVLQERIDAVSEACRTLLTRVAFLGDEVSAPEVALVSRASPEDAERWLDEAIDAGLLTESDHGVRFTHPQLRQLLYHSPRGRRRQALHLQLADALEEVHGDDDRWVGVVAHHLLHAGDQVPPDRLAQQSLHAAGVAVGVGAWGEAWELYEAALASEDIPFPSGYHALLHHRAAIASWKDHDNTRAIHHADEAVAHARALDDFERWGPAAVLGAQARSASGVEVIGTNVEREPLEAFIEAAGDDLPALRALAHAELAELSNHRNQPEQGLPHAGSAWKLAERAEQAGDDAVRRAVIPSIAIVHLGVLDLHEAVRWYEMGAAPEPPGSDPLPRVLCWVRLGLCRWLLGDLDAADKELEGAVPYARDGLLWANQALGLACLAGIAVARGDFDRAEQWGEQAEVVWRWSDFGFAPTVLYPCLAAARVARGDVGGARRALDEFERSGGRGVWRYRHLVNVRAGDIDTVRAELETRPLRPGPSRPVRLFDLAAAGALLSLAVDLDLKDLAASALTPVIAAHELGVTCNLGWPFVLPDLIARAHELLDG